MVVLMMVISIVKYLQAGIIILFNLQVEGVVRFGCGLPELMVKYQVLLSRVYRGYYEKNIYYEGNHCPTQILRNCVHPEVGLHVFNEAAL